MKNKNSNIKATGVLLVLILMLMLGLIYINNMNSISTSGSKDIKNLSFNRADGSTRKKQFNLWCR